MRLPKKFWRVELKYGEGKKLRTYEMKSKTYADERHALDALDRFRARGIECVLYESEPVVWKIKDSGPPLDHPELPFD